MERGKPLPLAALSDCEGSPDSKSCPPPRTEIVCGVGRAGESRQLAPWPIAHLNAVRLGYSEDFLDCVPQGVNTALKCCAHKTKQKKTKHTESRIYDESRFWQGGGAQVYG